MMVVWHLVENIPMIPTTNKYVPQKLLDHTFVNQLVG